jgi:hypothetical protein
MKAAIDNKANMSMAFLFASFLFVMALFVFWPKATGNPTNGYTPDGTAVQSDTISPKTAAGDASTTR